MAKSKVTIGNVDKFKERIKLMSNGSKKFVAVTIAGLVLTGVTYGCDSGKETKPINNTSVTAEQDSVVYQDDIDFDAITVVFETNGEDSKEIIDGASHKLQDLGVSVYVAENDCFESIKESLVENPTDDILVVRVGGEKNKTGQNVVMTNYNDAYNGVAGLRNSDSLAASINSELNGSKLVAGKLTLNNSITTRDATDIEMQLSDIDPNNRGVKNVTIAINEDNSYSYNVTNAIVKGVAKYAALDRKERDASYYRLAGVVRIPESSGKDWQDAVKVNSFPDINIDIEKYANERNSILS